jgi:hypothetical protein
MVIAAEPFQRAFDKQAAIRFPMRATRRFVFVLFLVPALAGLVPGDAEACTCLRPGAPCEAYWEVDAVFVGKVTSIAGSSGRLMAGRAVTFAVLESLKGDVGKEAVVRTGSGGGDCGYGFREGVTYVVYATRSRDVGALSTNICTRTRPVDTGGDDIAYGRSVMADTTPPGRVTGRATVTVDSLQPQTRRPEPKPIAGVGVTLERNGRSYSGTTGEDGTFMLEGLEAGKYTVRVTAPTQYHAPGFPRELDLRDTRACADIAVALLYDGRVGGRVLNFERQPVAGLTLELTVRGALDQPYGPRRLRTTTAADGSYEFARVPPGKYVVGVNTQLDRTGGVPEGRAFLPGVRAPASARDILVGAGERVRAADFILPDDVRYAAITGVVLEPDGATVEGARVYVKGVGGEDYILTEPAVTDGRGRFTIAALAGRDCVVFAERVRSAGSGPGRLDVSDQLTTTPADASKPVILRLKRQY